jgi:hypothetical protein
MLEGSFYLFGIDVYQFFITAVCVNGLSIPDDNIGLLTVECNWLMSATNYHFNRSTQHKH